jgi:hypothetical protein
MSNIIAAVDLANITLTEIESENSCKISDLACTKLCPILQRDILKLFSTTSNIVEQLECYASNVNKLFERNVNHLLAQAQQKQDHFQHKLQEYDAACTAIFSIKDNKSCCCNEIEKERIHLQEGKEEFREKLGIINRTNAELHLIHENLTYDMQKEMQTSKRNMERALEIERCAEYEDTQCSLQQISMQNNVDTCVSELAALQDETDGITNKAHSAIEICNILRTENEEIKQLLSKQQSEIESLANHLACNQITLAELKEQHVAAAAENITEKLQERQKELNTALSTNKVNADACATTLAKLVR